jgi:hypothetical protein
VVIGDEKPFPKEWVERVAPKVRKDHPPSHPAGYIIVLSTVLAACAIIVLACYVFLVLGVLVIR